jgi:xylulokinase
MILVFDLGTSYFKFALIDRSVRLVDSCRIQPPVRSAPPGTMELDAEAFVDVLGQGIAQLAGRNPGSLAAVQAVTFATQTNSFVLLDTACRPLTPIILWPDIRAAGIEEEFRRLCALPGFTATTGIPALTRQFMAAKLLWIQRHAPQAWKRTAKICLISDYLTLLLTGQHVTEAGTAGLTGLLDIHHLRWWPELLARLNIPSGLLPQVVRAGSDLGPISLRAANPIAEVSGFGLSPHCHFVVGCLDQYAGAIGAGNVRPGSVSETTGTVLATVRCADQFQAAAAPGVFQGPAFAKDLYYQMVFGEVSANYLEWYRRQLPDRPDFIWLAAQAARIAPHKTGLRLRSDVPLSAADSGSTVGEVFEGLTPAHTPGHVVRCIMETVAAALREQVMALSRGSWPAEIRSAGGGARSDLWLQIKADTLEMPVRATECPEPTCLGASMLAEAALSNSGIPAIAQRWVRLKPVMNPVAST